MEVGKGIGLTDLRETQYYILEFSLTDEISWLFKFSWIYLIKIDSISKLVEDSGSHSGNEK